MSEPFDSCLLPDLHSETDLASGHEYVGEEIVCNALGWFVPIKTPKGLVVIGKAAYGRAAAIDAIKQLGGKVKGE